MAAPRANSTSDVVVVAGGEPLDAAHVPSLADGALVVAADSGIDLAHALGLRVDVAVGDFDSVSPEALEAAVAAGAVIERHPEAKDATDLELALDAALVRGARRVQVLGGHGGRLDHLLGNIVLLAAPKYAPLQLVAQLGSTVVTVVRSAADLHGEPGDVVTLLAVHGTVRGVVTTGLRYPLRDEDLAAGSTRGVSNVLEQPTARVSLRSGTLLAVQPGPDPQRRT